MARTRSNRGATSLSHAQMEEAKKAYKDWHWGLPVEHVFDWPDPDFPDRLIQCGRLCEMKVRLPGRRQDTALGLAEPDAMHSHLCFDLDHRHRRLYLCLSKNFMNDMRVTFWGKHEPWFLPELAEEVGGRHASGDYLNIEVTPIGILTKVTYFTGKKDDVEQDKGKGSFYVHTMGEESGIRPYLAVDRRGRLWVAGGNYTSPNPGITD